LCLLSSLGGLQLKNLQLQCKALMLHRTINIICEHPESISGTILRQVISKFEFITPVNINLWRYYVPYLFEPLLEILYSSVDNYNLATLSVKQLYKYIFDTENQEDNAIVSQYPNCNWLMIWQNINALKSFPHLHDLRYRLVYGKFETKYILFEKGIVPYNLCNQCTQVDSILHRLTQCKNSEMVWNTLLTILSRICRTSTKSFSYEQLIYRPEFKYFPPTKHKFVNWFIAQTLYLLLVERDIDSVPLYINQIILRYLQIDLQYRSKHFAQYFRAIY